jgi:type IV fimbrial biogenesis protein FimT
MHQRGFSLIELLMGLTIVGIVLHLVSPAFAALSESTYREETAKSLASGMRSARVAAITRNQPVVIHGINDDWSQGWRIVLDVSGKGHEDISNPLLMEHRSGNRVPVFGNQHVRTSYASVIWANRRKRPSIGDITRLRQPRTSEPAPGGAGVHRPRQPAQRKS